MIVLVLGGARSGKSEIAESLAARFARPEASVVYVATASSVGDPEFEARIAEHRLRRPASWTTVEVGPGGDLARELRAARGVVLVDSLGAWVAGLAGFAVEARDLCVALEQRTGDTVVVSDEVGLGVHPSSEVGRLFRDALGSVNRAVAGVADEVFLAVAGRVLRLEGAGTVL
jgi:adenosylcobinamide kinase/adenosylcobinamide-phosphate guanylyltransferase